MFEKIFPKYITPQNIIFFIVAILFLYMIFKIKDIAILFFASYVIACSLNPLVDKLSKKMKRSLASAIVLSGTILLGGVLFIPIIAIAGHEVKSFISHLPAHIETVKTFIAHTPILKNIQASQFDINNLISSASGVTSNVLDQSITASKSLATAIIYMIVAILIIYYFIADKDIVENAYTKLFPTNMKEKADKIMTAISQKIGGYVLAQVVTLSSVGIVMTLGLLICGIEYAFLLGIMTAILDIVPVVGPAIALIICLVTTFKAGGIAMGLVILVFAITQIVENNLVRPYIFGKILDIHPLIIYLFLLITAQYLGIIGVLFAPAIAATVCVLIDELYIKNIN